MPTNPQLKEHQLGGGNHPNLSAIRQQSKRIQHVDAEALRVSRMPEGEAKTSLQGILKRKEVLQSEIDSLESMFALILGQNQDRTETISRLRRQTESNQDFLSGIEEKTKASLMTEVVNDDWDPGAHKPVRL